MQTELDIEKYKVILAKDLIIYLFTIMLSKSDKKTSIELIENILQAWQTNLTMHLNKIQENDLLALAEAENYKEDMDVTKIIMEIHSLFPSEISKEFLSDLLISLQGLIDIKE